MVQVPDLSGKVILITGATDGIGRVTAEALAKKGARVVLVGRNPEKTRSVVSEIKNNTHNEQVDYMLADLSNQAEVRALAQAFKDRYDRLDVLINNAGALFMSRQTSADGYEMTFALNHLAYFLLTNLLLDLLIKSAPARIVNVSSAAHVASKLNFEDLQNEHGFTGWRAYAQSKLANLYFTYELARRLEGTGVTVNALHPGFVASNFGKSNGSIFRPLFSLFQIGAISPEKGAETEIYLAASPDVAGVTGKYFSNKKQVSSSSVSYDQEAAQRLWDASLALTGLSEKA